MRLKGTDASLLVTEYHGLLAEQLYLLRQIAELIRLADWLPIAAQEFTHWAARLDAGQLVFGWRCLPSVCRSHHSLPLLVTAASGYWVPKNVDHLLSF